MGVRPFWYSLVSTVIFYLNSGELVEESLDDTFLWSYDMPETNSTSMMAVQRRDYLMATAGENGRKGSTDGKGVWRLPEDGQMKLNCDATLRRGVGATGETVLRFSDGQVSWHRVYCLPDIIDVAVAEALAVIEGLVEARSHGGRNRLLGAGVCFDEDDEYSSSLSYFGILFSHTLSLVDSFSYVSFSWVRRTENIVAHRLVILGLPC